MHRDKIHLNFSISSSSNLSQTSFKLKNVSVHSFRFRILSFSNSRDDFMWLENAPKVKNFVKILLIWFHENFLAFSEKIWLDNESIFWLIWFVLLEVIWFTENFCFWLFYKIFNICIITWHGRKGKFLDNFSMISIHIETLFHEKKKHI